MQLPADMLAHIMSMHSHVRLKGLQERCGQGDQTYLLSTGVGTRRPHIITPTGRVALTPATGCLAVSLPGYEVSRALAKCLLLAAGVAFVWLSVRAGAGSQQ